MAHKLLISLAVGSAMLLAALVPASAGAGEIVLAQAREKDPHVEAVRKAIRRHERDFDRLMPGERGLARSLLSRIRSSERRLRRSEKNNDKRWIESEMRLRELEEDVQRWIRVHGDK